MADNSLTRSVLTGKDRDLPQRRRGGRGGMRKTGRSRKGLNTKAPRHKGQRGKRCVVY